MLKRLLVAIAILLVPLPALAWTHGVAASSGNSPIVTAGAVQPQYDPASSGVFLLKFTNVNYNNISTTFHGSSGDYGYDLRTFARWDNPSFLLMSGTFQVGLITHHSPTNAELKSGLWDNVSSVQVRCDEGSYATITGPSVNNSAGGTVDWNFTVNDATWADGLHKCDAIVIPTTGPDGVMNGPPITALGQRPEEYQSVDQMKIDSGTLGTAGHIMTIPATATVLNSRNSTSNAPQISVGWSVSAYKVAPGTFIDGDSTHNATSCVAETGSNCTGAGAAGTYHLTGPSQTVYGAVGTGTINNTTGGSGTILTITAISSGSFDEGLVSGPNITSATIDGTANDSGLNLCTSQTGMTCTGGFGVGTYHVTGSNQNAASGAIYLPYTTATLGDERSFYFLTNHNGTLPRGTVYVCNGTCNGVTGSDSNSGLDATHPVLTTGKAEAVALTFDATAPNMNGKWGGTVCLMNSGTSYSYASAAGIPFSWIGYNEYVAANDPACGVGTDPGGEHIINNSLTRNYISAPGRTLWRGLVFEGAADNQDPGDATFFVAQNVTETVALYNTGGIFSGAAWWCTESRAFFAGFCGGADVVRNSTIKYTQTDPIHNVHAAWGNTIDGGGGAPMSWVTGVYNPAAPSVLTSVTLPSDVTAAGNTLTSIFVGDGNNHIPTMTWGTFCTTGQTGAISSATSNTITFAGTVTDLGVCTNGTTVFVWGNDGNHPDFLQLSGNVGATRSAYFDVFYLNNTFNLTYTSNGQDPFFEATRMDGLVYAGNSSLKNVNDSSKADATNGGNNNVTYANNIWNGSGFFQHNGFAWANGETFFKDRCLSGGTLIPPVTAGTNQQTFAAASNACYTTSP